MKRLTHKNHSNKYELKLDKDKCDWQIGENETSFIITGDLVNRIAELENVLDSNKFVDASSLKYLAHSLHKSNTTIAKLKLEIKELNETIDLLREILKVDDPELFEFDERKFIFNSKTEKELEQQLIDKLKANNISYNTNKQEMIVILNEILNNFKNQSKYFDVGTQTYCLADKDKQFIQFVNEKSKN